MSKKTANWNGKVIAEADQNDLVFIEGNWYFPASTVHSEFLEPSELTTECFWKGTASYYTLVDGDTKGVNLAWYYPNPKEGSEDKVGKPFANFVAFYPQVTIS
jgi:uncharacterized protein (DUF427 family)